MNTNRKIRTEEDARKAMEALEILEAVETKYFEIEEKRNRIISIVNKWQPIEVPKKVRDELFHLLTPLFLAFAEIYNASSVSHMEKGAQEYWESLSDLIGTRMRVCYYLGNGIACGEITKSEVSELREFVIKPIDDYASNFIAEEVTLKHTISSDQGLEMANNVFSTSTHVASDCIVLGIKHYPQQKRKKFLSLF